MNPYQNPFKMGTTSFDFSKKTVIMGILNVTPDSFSDGGKYHQRDRAIQHAKEMVAAGADIIDIGGESSRPGHVPISAEEEMGRVLPIIEAVKKEIDIPISIDTYKASVAKEAIKLGVSCINDIWGGQKDGDMFPLIASTGVAYILMHNRSVPTYENLIEDILKDMRLSFINAIASGIQESQIIIDPGFGFAKNPQQNIQLLQSLDKVAKLGFPVLMGTSRKSMIGAVLNLPVHEREEGTIATVCFGIQKGANIVRVHEVDKVFRAVRMMDELVGRRELNG